MNKQTFKRYLKSNENLETAMSYVVKTIKEHFDNTANYYREERRKEYLIAELRRNTLLRFRFKYINVENAANIKIESDIDTGNTKSYIDVTFSSLFRAVDFRCIKSLLKLGELYLPRFELYIEGNEPNFSISNMLGFIDNELMSKCNLIDIRNIKFDRLKTADSLFGTDNTQTCPAEIRIDNCIFKDSDIGNLFNRTGFIKISLTNCKFIGWVRKLNEFFKYCEYLEEIDITGTDFDKVLSMSETFRGCGVLKEIKGLDSIDTSRCITFKSCFEGCKCLKELDLSSWVTTNARSYARMFNETYDLKMLNIDKFELANRDVTQMLYTNVIRTDDFKIIHNNGSKAVIKDLDIVDVEYKRIERFEYYSASTEVCNIEAYDEKRDEFTYSNPNSREINKLFDVYRISKDEFNRYTTKELKELYNGIINMCNFSKGCRLFDIKSNYRISSQEMLNIGTVVSNIDSMSEDEFSKHVILRQIETEDDLKNLIRTRLLKRDLLGVKEFMLDLGIAYMIASSETKRVELIIGMEETK